MEAPPRYIYIYIYIYNTGMPRAVPCRAIICHAMPCGNVRCLDAAVPRWRCAVPCAMACLAVPSSAEPMLLLLAVPCLPVPCSGVPCYDICMYMYMYIYIYIYKCAVPWTESAPTTSQPPLRHPPPLSSLAVLSCRVGPCRAVPRPRATPSRRMLCPAVPC